MQSNETNGSYGMELEGLKGCKKELEGYAIKALVTDRHRQIAKWIRENWDVAHFFDCWHIVKGKQMFINSMFKPDLHSLYSHGIFRHDIETGSTLEEKKHGADKGLDTKFKMPFILVCLFFKEWRRNQEEMVSMCRAHPRCSQQLLTCSHCQE